MPGRLRAAARLAGQKQSTGWVRILENLEISDMKKLLIILLLFAAIATASASIFINSFNSGQLSKDMKQRHDLDRTSMGSETLQNILIRPQGMAYKRPGTEFIAGSYGKYTADAGQVVTHTGVYPTLQELTAAEIPDAPNEPSATAATTAVSNATELQAMSGSGKYYLTADINLAGVTWTPITGFTGVLDGRNYTISNLTINSAASNNRALFGTTGNGAEIYDLILDGFNITGKNGVGTLIGGRSAAGTILLKNIEVTNSSISCTTYGGILAGDLYNLTAGDIYNCSSDVNCIVNGCSFSGGIFGEIIMSSSATGNVSVTDCNAAGNLVITTSSTTGVQSGGFVGYASGNTNPTPDRYVYFHSCNSSVVISSDVDTGKNSRIIGGFIGYAESCYFISCSSSGNITIAGDSTYIIGAVGGFVGFEYKSIDYLNSYSESNISIDCTGASSLNLIGGFGGKIDVVNPLTFTRCYSKGNITITGLTDSVSWYGIGGFIGGYLPDYSNGSGYINRCWAQGDLTLNHEGNPDSDYKGGIGAFIGVIDHDGSNPSSNVHEIHNCYAWGSVLITEAPGDYDVALGGFIGAIRHYMTNGTTVELLNCYDAQTDTAAGSGYSNQLTITSDANGLIGWVETGIDVNEVNEPSLFWDTETSDILIDDYAVGHITSWMQTRSNYEAAGWNFDTIWVLDMTTTTSSWSYSGFESADDRNNIRLIPFEHSTDDAYVLEFGHKFIGFLRTTQ
jgi:hypothetical protein